ncbi:DNA repair protein complementing XP-A cells homolog isoform X2 [Lineus longissimus]
MIETAPKLTDAQRARIERNRQHALLLKRSRELKKTANRIEPPSKKNCDSGAGFVVDDEEEEQGHTTIVHDPAPINFGDRLMCTECGGEMLNSYLYKQFNLAVCDKCKEDNDEYDLITKTDAKKEYLLKDHHFEKDPPLKFIEKKNPRHDRWGTMKLYLKKQVITRSLEVHGGEDGLEEKKEERKEKREEGKQKKFDKKMKQLRMTVRSSLYKKESAAHEHVYGGEEYDEEEDVYTKTCQSCGHKLSYEKM